MKKLKEDFKTILEVVAFLFICLFFPKIDSQAGNYLCLIFLLTNVFYVIYRKTQYESGKANYILFPTANDNYYKTTNLTLGIIALLATIAMTIWMNISNTITLIGFYVGLIRLLNWIFDLPSGQIKLEGNLLHISGLTNYKTETRQIKEIDIHPDKILIINTFNEFISVNNLKLDLHSAVLIENYILNNKLSQELKIVNNVI